MDRKDEERIFVVVGFLYVLYLFEFSFRFFYFIKYNFYILIEDFVIIGF